MNGPPSRFDRIPSGLFLLLLLAGLCLSSLYSYPLFHLLAETFSTSVASGVFLLAWNARRFSQGGFLPLLGISSLFVGAIDLAHALSYQGMGLFRGYGADLPTQLWVAARYVQSLSLLAAPLFLSRPIRAKRTFALYFALTSLLLWAIFRGGIFPPCYIEGSGLTTFKKASEYVIAGMFLCAGAEFWRRRKLLDRDVCRLLVAAAGVFAAAELLFTLYHDVTGLSNLAGHVLKIVAFYLICRSILETGIVRPFDLLFRELKQSEESVRRANEELETRVAERTSELGAAVAALRAEIAEREHREEEIRLRNRELDTLYKMLQACSHPGNLRERLERALDAVLGDLDIAMGGIYVLEPEGTHQALAAHRGIPESLAESAGRLPRDRGLAGRVSRGRGPLLLAPPDDPEDPLACLARQAGARVVILAPISHDEAPAGLLVLGAHHSRSFSTDDSRLLSAVARQLGRSIRDACLEEEARLHQAQLIHANRMASLGVIVSGVAHEINNPNNLVTFNAPIIAAAWRDAQKAIDEHLRPGEDFLLGGLPYSEMRGVVPKLLSAIGDASRRITGIVGTLKGFARKEGRPDETVDINEVVRTAVAVLNHEILKETRDFRTEYGEELPPVRGARQELEQVVMNLILNALQSLPDRTRGVRVCTAFDREQGAVGVCVEDQGRGMPPEVLRRVMEPFFSTRQESGGLGLGLSICQTILGKHQGTLSFESEPGKGTRARILLPCIGQPSGGATVLESVSS